MPTSKSKSTMAYARKPAAAKASNYAGRAKGLARKARSKAARRTSRHVGTKPAATKARRTGQRPRLLTGGNPQIAKADGDAPVQAYIAAMPGWKSGVGRRLDALIVRAVPDLRKAVKWNSGTRPSTGSRARAGS
jgi:hypothetical protein